MTAKQQPLEDVLAKAKESESWVNKPVSEKRKAKPKRKNAVGFTFDDSAYDQLEEYEGRGWWKPPKKASRDYLSDMWGRQGWGRGYSGLVDERDTKVAHGMVQGFLNSFSRDGRYVFVFDEDTSTAGTDMKAKIVRGTTAPLLDKSITAEEAGHILTAIALHEISHPRYGRNTSEAVEMVFGRSVVARQLSNLLDDVRIERRYEEDYPGYTGIFEPALKYIGEATVKKNKGKLLDPPITDQYNIATGALRYPSTMAWTDETKPERDWWLAWASRWWHEDSPKRHVAAIREALEHVVEVKAASDAKAGQEEPEQTGSNGDTGAGSGPEATGSEGAGGVGESNDAGASGFTLDDLESEEEEDPYADPIGDRANAAVEASQGHRYDTGENPRVQPHEVQQETAEGQAADRELGNEADAATRTPVGGQETARLPSCAGTRAVETAAGASGINEFDIDQARTNAQGVVEDMLFHEDDGHGHTVDVARSMRGLPRDQDYSNDRRYVKSSDAATRYVRDALLSSRTGHTNVSHYKRRGRLDERALHRVVGNDYRLFDRKTKQSPGKYLIWVMVDKSSSMDGYPSRDAAAVAMALASASEYVDTMRMSIWAWSWQFRVRQGYAANAGVCHVWHSGDPIKQIPPMVELVSGGTPDSTIMSWAGRAILREVRPGEQPVILMCSDGEGYGNLQDQINEVRAMGVKVISVAIGSDVAADSQKRKYGEGNFITWQGSIIATARPLARMLAKLVTQPMVNARRA